MDLSNFWYKLFIKNIYEEYNVTKVAVVRITRYEQMIAREEQLSGFAMETTVPWNLAYAR